ncbi:DNA replication protein DnaC [Bradyrhizobium sp. LM2.7]
MTRTKKATEAPIDRLEAMLVRLQLSGIRDQLDNLLEEAARANLSARETLILLCEREIARKDHHVYEDEPYKFTLLEGVKGVQLAESALKSWKERRWIDVAPIKA